MALLQTWNHAGLFSFFYSSCHPWEVGVTILLLQMGGWLSLGSLPLGLQC